jgi:hypothetical protein
MSLLFLHEELFKAEVSGADNQYIGLPHVKKLKQVLAGLVALIYVSNDTRQLREQYLIERNVQYVSLIDLHTEHA